MEKQIKVTVGENLRRIRKDLDLKQHEIAGEDITRNLISLIENDKAILYDTAANIIAKNINRIMNERNSNIFIKPEDLLNPERYDARKKANTYIEMLENSLAKKELNVELEELNEIEAFLNHWDIVDKKVRIYELLGDIFYVSNNLSKEYYYYFKALEASYDHPNMKARYKLALKLVYNCIVTGKNEEAINLCNYMLLSQKDMPDRVVGIFYYNSALAHRKLDDIDKCLKELNNAKEFISDDGKELKKILMLEGISYFKTKNYNKAIKSYEKILELCYEKNSLDETCATYINIIQIYMKKNDKDNVLKYFDKVMIMLPYLNEDSFYLPEIYYEISNIYFYLKNYETCEKYLNAALALSKKNGMHYLYKKFISSLLDLYIEANYFDKLSELIKSLEDEIGYCRLNEESILVLKVLLYFVKQNSNKVAEDLIERLLQKVKEV